MFAPALKIRAQNVLSNGGSRNEAIGSLTSVSVDEWSLWRNPAGLVSLEQPRASSSLHRSQSVTPFTRSFVFAMPTKAGSFATGISSFGDALYNESIASLGFGNRLGLASLGIRADVYQLRVDGEAARRAVGITAGCIAKISKKLSVGICARNINLPEWTRGQPLPIVLNSGFSFTPSDNFMVVGEVEKNTDFDPTFKGGFEYNMRKKFFFRTGFNLFPNAAFGGIGLRMWCLGVDYALKYGFLPGYAQQLSITIQLKR